MAPNEFIGFATLFVDLPVICMHCRIYRVPPVRRVSQIRGEKSCPADCAARVREKRGVETKARRESRANRKCSKYADVVIANGNAVSLYNFQTNEASESDIMIRAANIRIYDTVKEHGQF